MSTADSTATSTKTTADGATNSQAPRSRPTSTTGTRRVSDMRNLVQRNPQTSFDSVSNTDEAPRRPRASTREAKRNRTQSKTRGDVAVVADIAETFVRDQPTEHAECEDTELKTEPGRGRSRSIKSLFKNNPKTSTSKTRPRRGSTAKDWVRSLSRGRDKDIPNDPVVAFPARLRRLSCRPAPETSSKLEPADALSVAQPTSPSSTMDLAAALELEPSTVEATAEPAQETATEPTEPRTRRRANAISHGTGAPCQPSQAFPELPGSTPNLVNAPEEDPQPDENDNGHQDGDAWTRSVRNSFSRAGSQSINSAKSFVRERRNSLSSIASKVREVGEKGGEKTRSLGRSASHSVKTLVSKKPKDRHKESNSKGSIAGGSKGASFTAKDASEDADSKTCKDTRVERQATRRQLPKRGTVIALFDPPTGAAGVVAHADRLAEDAAEDAPHPRPDNGSYTDVFDPVAEYADVTRTTSSSTYDTAHTHMPEYNTSLDTTWPTEELDAMVEEYKKTAAADGIDLDEIQVDLTVGSTAPLEFRDRVQELVDAGMERMTRAEFAEWERNEFRASVYGVAGMDFSKKEPWTVWSPGKTPTKAAPPPLEKRTRFPGDDLRGMTLDLSEPTYGNTLAFQARAASGQAGAILGSPAASEGRLFHPPQRQADLPSTSAPPTVRQSGLQGTYHATTTIDSYHAAYVVNTLHRDVSISTQSEDMDLAELGLASPTSPQTPGQAYFVRGVLHSRPVPPPPARLSSDPLDRRQRGERMVREPAHKPYPAPPAPAAPEVPTRLNGKPLPPGLLAALTTARAEQTHDAAMLEMQARLAAAAATEELRNLDAQSPVSSDTTMSTIRSKGSKTSAASYVPSEGNEPIPGVGFGRRRPITPTPIPTPSPPLIPPGHWSKDTELLGENMELWMGAQLRSRPGLPEQWTGVARPNEWRGPVPPTLGAIYTPASLLPEVKTCRKDSKGKAKNQGSFRATVATVRGLFKSKKAGSTGSGSTSLGWRDAATIRANPSPDTFTLHGSPDSSTSTLRASGSRAPLPTYTTYVDLARGSGDTLPRSNNDKVHHAYPAYEKPLPPTPALPLPPQPAELPADKGWKARLERGNAAGRLEIGERALGLVGQPTHSELARPRAVPYGPGNEYHRAPTRPEPLNPCPYVPLPKPAAHHTTTHMGDALRLHVTTPPSPPSDVPQSVGSTMSLGDRVSQAASPGHEGDTSSDGMVQGAYEGEAGGNGSAAENEREGGDHSRDSQSDERHSRDGSESDLGDTETEREYHSPDETGRQYDSDAETERECSEDGQFSDAEDSREDSQDSQDSQEGWEGSQHTSEYSESEEGLELSVITEATEESTISESDFQFFPDATSTPRANRRPYHGW